ncbi:MAG: mucoidy inhibitor MuiA family protein [Beijerinckiaceae bacterium]|nr:mucoidy inhibitor MuiA family protein [Beijerinckiaceae bacterium]
MPSSSRTFRPAVFLAPGISMLAFCIALPTLAAVIVYPDAAQVTRVAEVDVAAGAHVLAFKDLPVGLDVNSLRMRAVGADGLVIGSVESRITAVERPARQNSIEEKLRALINERDLLNKQMAVLQAKERMIELYAKASPEKLGEKTSPMNVADWSKAWNAVGEGLAKNAEDVQAAQLRQAEVTKEINALRRSNQGGAAGAQPRRMVSVNIEAAAAGKARVFLTYRVRGASWRPVYDARLNTNGTEGKPSLQLVRRASVRQRTGEDWSGIVLKVSTVRSNRGTQAPDLLAQRLEFYNPAPPAPPSPIARAPRARDDARKQAGSLQSGALMESRMSYAGAAKPAAEPVAVASATAYEAQFLIQGKTDLKADNSARILLISNSMIAPDLLVRATPALDTTAYLEAEFVNTDAAPLLPGIVNIHRDGSFAGRGRIKLVAPGDSVTLGFGADDSVRIKRVPVSRKQSGPGWIGKSRSEVKDFKTSVTNLHGFAIKMRLMDRVPVSEDDTIKIKALPSNTVATQSSVDGRRGVMQWTFDLKPQASKDIRLGWLVEWPDGKRLVPRNLPN